MPKAPKSIVGKSKVNKLVHPNSRQASYQQKRLHHEHRAQKSKTETATKQEQLREKLVWFQEHLDADLQCYTKHQLAVLTSDYLSRFVEEIEQISIVKAVGNRHGNQHVARETAIKLTQDKERLDFETNGFEVPDLINGKHLQYFRNWSGEIRFFPNIKMRKVRKADLDGDSQKDIVENEDGQESDVEENK